MKHINIIKLNKLQHANAVIDIVIVLPIKDLNEKNHYFIYILNEPFMIPQKQLFCLNVSNKL